MKMSNALGLAVGLFLAGSLHAAPLKVNPEATGKASLQYVEKIDDLMPGYIRAMSFQKSSEFHALQFAVMLNQSASIEKKLDALIAEMRETNRLLREKK